MSPSPRGRLRDTRRDQARLSDLLRTHRVCDDINRILVSRPGPQAAFDEACRVLVDDGGFLMAWIGLADPDTGVVNPVAHAGEANGYIERLNIVVGSTPRSRGPTGRALSEGKHVVCNDLANDPAMAPWRDDALALGYGASAAFPFVVRGETRGILNLYAAEPNFFDEEEVGLLDRVASNLSIAMRLSEEEEALLEAEEAIRSSQARCWSILENTMDAVLETEPSGTILGANPAACRVFGMTEAEICEAGRAGLVDGDDPRLERWLAQRQRSGRASGTFTFLRKDGTRFEGEVTSGVYATPSGQRTSWVIRDVTERSRTEDERQEHLGMLREAALIGNLGYWERDIGVDVVTWSPEVFEMFSLDPERSQNRLGTLLDLTHPEDREKVREAVEEALAGGARYDLDYRVIHSDGEVRWVHSRGNVERDSSGCPRRMFGIVQDVTERKKTEERLWESEAQLREAQRVAHLGSWTWHIHSNALNWSDEMFRIFGIEKEKFTGDLQDVIAAAIHPDDRAAVEEANRSVAEDQTPTPMEYRVVWPDGTVRVVWAEGGELVLDEAGKPLFFTGIVQDITGRKEAEEALKRSHAQLRALAARLESIREEERRAVARELHDELGQALTSLRMDLSQIGVEPPPKHEWQARVDDLIEVVDTNIDLVQNLSARLRPPILDVMGLAAALEWHADQVLARTPLAFHLDIEPNPMGLSKSDEAAVFRVVQEALTNVQRHAKASSVGIRLKREPEVIVLEVQDDGVGVPANAIERISSLGLIGMRERAQALGGVLAILPAEGTGSIIRLCIPVREG